jgi:hypothetical protein
MTMFHFGPKLREIWSQAEHDFIILFHRCQPIGPMEVEWREHKTIYSETGFAAAD